LGATGLTGRMVVEKLLKHTGVSSVVVPVRRSLGLKSPKLAEHLVDFDALESHSEIFKVDALVCCLGTTIKKAGSQEAFRKVDYEYAHRAAKLARAAGVNRLILMSAIGASAQSTVFYSRVKGELEDAVRGLGFDYLSIYHPSLLLGDRKEHRTGEAIGMAVMPLANRALIGPLQKYRAIEAEVVAAAMVNELIESAEAKDSRPVINVREYDDIRRLAKQG
ncbi:MAG: NAD(P)H-binding protein, partial [Marinobacter sp.]|nr:NAD(P)H-binding protein [Marinobacter sp.]